MIVVGRPSGPRRPKKALCLAKPSGAGRAFRLSRKAAPPGDRAPSRVFQSPSSSGLSVYSRSR
jgi:hypothetical protein